MAHPHRISNLMALGLTGWLAALNASATDLVAIRKESTLTAPKVAVAPAIDGALQDAAWAQAQPLREWSFGDKGVLYQTEAWVCRDDQNLYVAARCFDDNLKGRVTAFDGGAIWKNDCVEVYIVPEQKPKFYSHIILSCDGKSTGDSWVTDEWGEATAGKPLALNYRTGTEANVWTVEVAIPLASFGHAIDEKSTWALGVNREKQGEPIEVSSFQGGFNAPRQYAALRFHNAPIVVDGVGVRNLSDKALSLVATLKSEQSSKELEFTLKPGDRQPFDWQKALAPATGSEFTIDVRDKAGMQLTHERYAVGTAKDKGGPIDLTRIPPAQFAKSVLDDPEFFPIAVWCQPAGMAARYKEIGVNVYVEGIDSYPTPQGKAFLDEIAKQGMYAFCGLNEKNAEAKIHEHPAFLGWFTTDEPDNVNPATGKVFGTPEELLAMFAKIRTFDATHPVYLNLGCGVADERFTGRGATFEQYQQYPAACDILSYDIYPCNSLGADGPQRLYMEAKGLDRLRQWAGPEKRIWTWIEASQINKSTVKDSRAPTPEEVKTMIWMALVHGATGYGFFCHSFAEKFAVSGIAPAMMTELATINGEVKSLARVLNSPSVAAGATLKAGPGERVDVLVKKVAGTTYVFAVNMLPRPAQALVTVTGLGNKSAEVLFENRKVELKNGAFAEAFAPFAVHRYRIAD